ncbi:MAG: Fur family transcriptional regulator [Chloroflexota bacterium]
MIEKYITILRSRGYRMTPQRLAILGILLGAKRHLSAQEICEMAHQAMPGLTEATVYRTLSFLVEQGLVLAAHIGSGQLAYEIAERPHHHLICRSCGYTMDIDHAWLEQLYEQFQEQTGFRIDSMHVTFFGLCPVCQK